MQNNTGTAHSIVYLPIEMVKLTPQPFEETSGKLYEYLKESIREYGILNPIHVMPDQNDPGKYLILDGRTRYKIATELGLQVVPCLVEYDINPETVTAHEYDVEVLRRSHSLEEVEKVVEEKKPEVITTLKEEYIQQIVNELPDEIKKFITANSKNGFITVEKLRKLFNETLEQNQEIEEKIRMLEQENEELKAEREELLERQEEYEKKMAEYQKAIEEARRKFNDEVNKKVQEKVMELKGKEVDQEEINRIVADYKKEVEESLRKEYSNQVNEIIKEKEKMQKDLVEVTRKLKEIKDKYESTKSMYESLKTQAKATERSLKTAEEALNTMKKRLREVLNPKPFLTNLQTAAQMIESAYSFFVYSGKADIVTEEDAKTFLDLCDHCENMIEKVRRIVRELKQEKAA